MTVPDAYGINNVTELVTPSVDADKPIKVHSCFDSSMSRVIESVERAAELLVSVDAFNFLSLSSFWSVVKAAAVVSVAVENWRRC